MMIISTVHNSNCVLHQIQMNDEDVEASFFIPMDWDPRKNANPLVILMVRHQNYISIMHRDKGTMLNVTDSCYPFKKSGMDAKEAFGEMSNVLYSFDGNLVDRKHVLKATKLYRCSMLMMTRERSAAFADLMIDFTIMGPILEYCEEAIKRFKEVNFGGSTDIGADEDPLGQLASTSTAHKDWSKDQEE